MSKLSYIQYNFVPFINCAFSTTIRHLKFNRQETVESFIMADNEDDDQYRIREGDYVVLKRGEIYKSMQIQLRK